MTSSESVQSPGPSNSLAHSDATPLLTSGENLTTNLDASSKTDKSLGHQGERSTGGVNDDLRILYCFGLPRQTDYELLFGLLKPFGCIERMKLKLSADKRTFDAYITYAHSNFAHSAMIAIRDNKVAGLSCKAKLFNASNLRGDDFDFVPRLLDTLPVIESSRTASKPIWHVATFKEGQANLI